MTVVEHEQTNDAGDTSDQDAGRARGAHGRRRAWGWTALIAVVVLLGLATLLVPLQEWQQKGSLDPEHPGPPGGMALAQILESQGVEVVVTRSRDDAMSAAHAGTLIVTGTYYLSDDHLDELLQSADRVIMIDPSSRDVRATFGQDVNIYGGYGSAPVPPSCEVPEASGSGDVQPGAAWPTGSADAACYPVGDDAYGLLRGVVGTTEVTLVDGTAIFANDSLATGGNAALGLHLLGADADLVWYVPSASDVDPAASADTLGGLTPPWVTPALVLLGVAVIAAGVWRGRRFGPLVAETLPVTVRGSETLEGRARLYERADDPAHAAALVRDGAIARISTRLGLHRRATRHEVAIALAARIGARTADVSNLFENLPQTDAQLAEFGERVRDLEAAADAAVRTERTTQ